MEVRLVLSLAGSDRAAHTPQPGSAQAQTHPLGFMASHLWASSLSRPQMRSGPAAEKHSQGCVGHQPPLMGTGKRRGHKWDRCFSLAEGPIVSKRLTKHSALQGKGIGVQPKTQGLERETGADLPTTGKNPNLTTFSSTRSY